MTDELKPCPFCGGKATISLDDGAYYCVDCGCMPYVDDGVEPIAAWNRREADEMPEWAIKEIQQMRHFVASSRFGDWKCDLCYDSECFQAVKAGIDRYLTLALSLRREDAE